jgi:hypothetical protein
MAADPPTKTPLKGILNACRIPPSAASLNAHNAVNFQTVTLIPSSVPGSLFIFIFSDLSN